MECHHDVIPVPSPARPPFRVFFNYQKQTKKLPKLGKYDHKDDNVEKGEYDTQCLPSKVSYPFILPKL